MVNNKWKEIVSNPSAYITVTLIFLGLLKSIGINIDVTNDGNVDTNDATILVNGVWQKHLSEIISFLVPIFAGLIGKISKIVITKANVMKYVTSSNFITAVFSLVVLILGVFLNQELVTVITVTIANILNFVYHLNIPINNDNSTESNK